MTTIKIWKELIIMWNFCFTSFDVTQLSFYNGFNVSLTTSCCVQTIRERTFLDNHELNSQKFCSSV